MGRLCVVGILASLGGGPLAVVGVAFLEGYYDFLALPRISRNLEKFLEAEFFIEGQAHFSGL